MKSFLDILIDKDFKEHPVSIEELICSKEFFGNITSGGKAIYPIWKEKLTEIFDEDTKFLVVFTGAIGTGKTTAMVIGMAMVIHRILCLKDPWAYHGKAGGGKLSVSFFNLTRTLSATRSYRILQDYLVSSPWFRAHGTLKGKGENQEVVLPFIDFRLAATHMKGYGILGHDVICASMDEVDSDDIGETDKLRIIKAYDATYRRFWGRFVHKGLGESLGKFFLAASKQDELSFLNTFVAENKKGPNLAVVDVPLWAVTGDELSGRTFSLAPGDIYTPSKILYSPRDVAEAQAEGKDLIHVPVEFFDAFKRDINGALRDIAGVSISGLRTSKLFASEKIIKDCYDFSLEDPVSKTTIECGLKTDIQLVKFIDFKKITMSKKVKRFIHADMAYAAGGDCLGLAMSGVKEWKVAKIRMPDGSYKERKVPIVQTDFAFRLKAPQGDQIHFAKMRDLILALHAKGYEITFTADAAAMSQDTMQILSTVGIECDYLSVDKKPDAYFAFKNTVNDERWICHWNAILNFELVNLEFDKDKQKIDHPSKVIDVKFLPDGSTEEIVTHGSKDIADAVAGSVFKALESADSLPVDEDLMIRIMSQIDDKVEEGVTRPNWFLDSDLAHSKDAEKFVLEDKQGQYWLWIRESPELSAKLTGPYPVRPLRLDPVKVDNPAAFIPRDVVKVVDDDRISKFLDLLDHVSKSQE